MRVGNLLTLNAFVAVGFALGFLLLPATMADIYGVTVVPATIFMARVFGAEVLGVGLICWFGSNSPGSGHQRKISVALLVLHTVGSVILVWAMLSGVLNAAGWSPLAIYPLLAIGYAFFLLFSPNSAETPRVGLELFVLSSMA